MRRNLGQTNLSKEKPREEKFSKWETRISKPTEGAEEESIEEPEELLVVETEKGWSEVKEAEELACKDPRPYY